MWEIILPPRGVTCFVTTLLCITFDIDWKVYNYSIIIAIWHDIIKTTLFRLCVKIW